MRLTEKTKNGYLHKLFGDSPIYTKEQMISDLDDIVQKLGQLEDIEDEFEIDDLEDLCDRLTTYKFLANHEMSCVEADAYKLMLKDLHGYHKIEEELGIDLQILIIALTNGFYAKGHEHLIMYPYLSTNAFDYDVMCGNKPVEWCLSKSHEDKWALKEYGKSWALTKEELL